MKNNFLTQYKTSFLSATATMLFSSLLLSCQSNKNAEGKTQLQQIDTIKRDIPVSRMNELSRQIKEKEEKLAGLENLENGFNELQLRIWFTYSNSIQHLIILKKAKGMWEGEINILKFKYKYSEIDTSVRFEHDTLMVIDKVVQKAQPKSGWKSFTDSLIALKILTLPDMSLIRDYAINNDGKYITIEVATTDKYRIYSYQDSYYYKDKFWQAQNVELISQLIEEEIGFKRL